uniref:Saposin B-type domain-containing protein n=1 Tax=Steinernema glaseri TaxID=37863 RepID=A0A1I8AGP6_9BILA
MTSTLTLVALVAFFVITPAASCSFGTCDGCKKIVDDTKAQFNGDFANVDVAQLREALQKVCVATAENPSCGTMCVRGYNAFAEKIFELLKAGDDSSAVCHAIGQCSQ